MVVSVTRRNERTDNLYKKNRRKEYNLEPPTYWFVASHSIQLSYKRNYEI